MTQQYAGRKTVKLKALDLKRARLGHKPWVLKDQLKSQSDISSDWIHNLDEERKGEITREESLENEEFLRMGPHAYSMP